MTAVITHATTASGTDSGSGEIHKAEWNANHTITGAVTPAQGGTGLTTLTANNLLVGEGTSNVSFIAPSTSGNILTSDGTDWTSAVPRAWTSIASGSINTGTSLTISSIPATYNDLYLKVDNLTQDSGATRNLTLNMSSDGGSTYTGAKSLYVSIASGNDIVVRITGYRTGLVLADPVGVLTMTAPDFDSNHVNTTAGVFKLSAAVDTLQLALSGSGNFTGTGTYVLYGS